MSRRILITRTLCTFATLGVLAVATQASAFTPSGGTIPTGPYQTGCKANPKACGAGYDPLKRPHVPTTPR